MITAARQLPHQPPPPFATPVASPQYPSEDESLPSAVLLGDGWEQLGSLGSVSPYNSAIYVGPKGSRLVIWSVNFGYFGRESLTRWDQVAEVFPRLADDTSLALRELPDISLDGCIDVLKARGNETLLVPATTKFLPIGYTTCLALNGVIISVVVAGDFNGLVGAAASDEVVRIVIDFIDNANP